MSGASKNGNKGGTLLLAVAPWFSAIALGVAAEVLGILAGRARTWEMAAYAVSLILLILLPVLGKLGEIRYIRRMNQLNVRELNDLVDAKKATIESDVAVAWRKLRRNCILARCWWAGYAILSMAVCFFLGACGRAGKDVLGAIWGIFNLNTYCQQLLFPKKQQESPAWVPQKEYPHLYALAREAAGDAWKDTPIRIWLLCDIPDSECNAAVSYLGGKIDLQLGIMTLNVLTEGELRQVLLHEFSHLAQQDSQRQTYFSQTMELLDVTGDSTLSVLPTWACGYIRARLSFQGQLYFLLSSRERERQADKQAAQRGETELQASALAKIACHDLWTFEREPYEVFCASPERPKDLMAQRVAAFRQALSEREDAWKTILAREIPVQVSTHPTFRQRWEELGCCAYSLTAQKGDTPLATECQALLIHVDEDLAQLPAEAYQQDRRENYEAPLALVTQWEKTEALLLPDEMRPILLAYKSLGQPEKMEALCDRILDWDSNPHTTHFTCYWKGKLLLYRYDKAGIAYIYKAIEANHNYIQPGLDAIGEFCTRMGLEAELAEYRRRAPELMQQVEDRQSKGLTRTKLAPETLPEDWVEKVQNVAQEASQGQLEKLYLVKELVSEDYQPSAFVLRFSPECDEEIMDAAYDRVFTLLDDWPVDWEFDLDIYEPKMEKALSRVCGSCVYKKEEAKP